jgi:hypothetical protein
VISSNEVDEETMACLSKGSEVYVSYLDELDEKNGSIGVYLTLDGCRREGAPVLVTLTSDAKSGPPDFLANGVKIEYKDPLLSGTDF